MTGGAAHGGFVLSVAVYAPFHLQRLLKTHNLLRRDIAMTPRTIELRCGMRGVTEKNKARQLVYQLERDLSISEVHVTGFTLRQRRETRPIPALGILVAECTLLL